MYHVTTGHVAKSEFGYFVLSFIYVGFCYIEIVYHVYASGHH